MYYVHICAYVANLACDLPSTIYLWFFIICRYDSLTSTSLDILTSGWPFPWWHHQKDYTFLALLALCEGNPSVTGGFPSQRPVTRSFDVFLSAPEQTVKQTVETPVIWDATRLIMTSLQWAKSLPWLRLIWATQCIFSHGIDLVPPK